MNLVGKILHNSPSMDDPNFNDSIILIVEHNEQGALGFVVNKIFDRPLNELVEFSNSPAFPLHDGGPVDKEHLYFIHQCNNLIPNSTKVIDDIFFGGDFKEAVKHINNKTLTTSNIKIFVGYCGWDTGELEAEIAEESWVLKEIKDHIFLY